MADQEDGDKGLMDKLSDVKSGFTSIGGSSEIQERIESGDLKPKPELVLDISNHEVSFPQNAEEAEGEWLDQMSDHSIGEETINEYRGGETGGIQVLIKDVEKLMSSTRYGGSLRDIMERNRSDMQRAVDELERELDVESGEEEVIGDWTHRLNRVLTFIDNLHRQLPDNLADLRRTDVEKIIIGDDPYGVQESGLDSGMQGLDFESASKAIDDWGIGYSSSTYSRSNRYGLAHALEDLQKINTKVLKPLASNASEEAEGKRDTLEDLAGLVERNENIFLQLMKVRLNIQQLEDREQIAEDIASEIKSSDADNDIIEQNMDAILQKVESEEEETFELKSDSEQILRQEAWMIEAFERAHNIMQQSFSVVDHVAGEDEQLRSRIEGHEHGASVRPHEFLKRLGDAFPDGREKQMVESVTEEYSKMVRTSEEIERLEATDIENILIMDRRIKNTLEKVESAEHLESKLEQMEDEEYGYVSDIEREKTRKVDRAVTDIDHILEDHFSSLDKNNLSKEFEQLKKELEQTGMELDELKDNKKDDIKKDEEIESTLEYVGKALQAVESDLDGDFEWGRPEVNTEFTHDGEKHRLDGTLDEVVHQILGRLGEIDDSISRQVEKEDGEEKDFFQAVEDFREVYEKVERMADGWQRIHGRIEQLKNDLDDIPEEYREGAMKEFRMEMSMLDEEEVYNYMQEFSEGKGKEMLEAAEDLLEKVSKEDRHETELLGQVAKVESKEDRRVQQLLEILHEHQRELPEKSDATEMLEEIHAKIKDINEKEELIYQDISEELDLVNGMDMFE